MGTFMVSFVLVSIVAVIITKTIKDSKKGKILGCDCGCKNCPKNSR